MAEWELTDAVESLRRRLADQATDKYIHLSPVDPEPDGIVRQFAVPDSRLVTGTVRVYLDGEIVPLPEYDAEADPVQEEFILIEPGRLELSAPDTGQKLRVCYYFQWFTDADIEEFLTTASQLLGFSAPTDASMSYAIRTPSLSFASHYAYLKLAALSAQALEAGAGGFTASNVREHPNWMAMAELAWKTAQNELEMARQDPVGGAAMRFVTYAMPRYVPRT